MGLGRVVKEMIEAAVIDRLTAVTGAGSSVSAPAGKRNVF
jgi:hypothetical protein